ncbi:hypothetical protein [Chryseobacterium sp. M5A1_1a]
MITEFQLNNKEIDELTFEEMAFVHLSDSHDPIMLKKYILRSTLSFARQNVIQALTNDHSKQLMPYITLCSILDQLGICYDRTDKPEPKFGNGLKRALVQYAELEEDDDLIDSIYALRNGLLHNISLTSFDTYKEKYYKFRYNSNISTVYKKAEEEWNGCYATLDTNPERFTTHINVELLKDLVFSCINNAGLLNQKSLLKLRLEGGVRQLFFDYILSIKK